MSLPNLAHIARAPAAQAQALAPASTTPPNASSLALVTENPYAYRAGLAKQQIYDLLLVAFALAAIGIALLSRDRLERATAPVFDRIRLTLRPRAR